MRNIKKAPKRKEEALKRKDDALKRKKEAMKKEKWLKENPNKTLEFDKKPNFELCEMTENI